MNILSHHLKALLCCFLLATCAHAEELNEILGRITKLVGEENYSKALGELKWAQADVEKKHMARLQSFLPEEVTGYKGTTVKPTSVLGFMELKRSYKNAEKSLQISIVGGASGSGAPGGSNPMAQIAQMGQMAAMMGGGDGNQETIRLNGRTATLKDMKGNGTSELTIFLDGGVMLKIESRAVAGAELKPVAEKIDVDAMEKYLKG